MRLYLDIETIPSQAYDAKDRARESIKPPGNYKKPESIAQWWETEGERAVQDAYLKQALDAAEGEIVALAYALNDAPAAAFVRPQGEAEAAFLRRVMANLVALTDEAQERHYNADFPEPIFLIAHNAMFDIGFVRRRCIVHGIQPPSWWPGLFARDGRDYGDTMTAWAGPRDRISLDRLCRTLGIPSPKAEGDGSHVFELWQAERYDDIARYCMGDVEAVRRAWARMNFEPEAAA